MLHCQPFYLPLVGQPSRHHIAIAMVLYEFGRGIEKIGLSFHELQESSVSVSTANHNTLLSQQTMQIRVEFILRIYGGEKCHDVRCRKIPSVFLQYDQRRRRPSSLSFVFHPYQDGSLHL